MWLTFVLAVVASVCGAQRDVDVAFILDGSGSVSAQHYYDSFLPFIQAVADSLPLDSNQYQFAVTTFGNEGEIQVTFNEGQNSRELAQILGDRSKVVFLNQNTNTSGGILVTRLMFSDVSSGARQDAQKIAILMTDGPATRGDPVPEANRAKQEGIYMYSFGIQRDPSMQGLNVPELRAIASDPSEVVIVDDFDGLSDNFEDHVSSIVANIRAFAVGNETESTTTSTTTTTISTTTTTQTPSTTTTQSPRTTTTQATRPTGRETPRTTTTPRQTTTQTPMSTTTVPQQSEWRCNFETDQGLPTNCGVEMSGFRWLPRVGATPSPGTGPRGAFNGDVYMYMEASQPRRENDHAMLFIPKRVFNGRQCVRFATHMTGNEIGAFDVMRVTGSGDENLLFSLNGQQEVGNWFERSVETNVDSSDRGIAFRGTVGAGRNGDIGLDNIRVTSGAC